MRNALNMVGYQLVWFAAVLGAARGWWWPGLVAALLFGSAQWWFGGRRRDDLRLAALAVVLGFALDGSLSLCGVLQYAAAPSPLPPAWLLAIWAAFGFTLNHSFALAQRHLGVTALVAAVGAPLAYVAAARLGAVAFAPPAWQGLAGLALGWSMALPLLAAAARGPRHAMYRGKEHVA
jgi:hypothetical protein